MMKLVRKNATAEIHYINELDQIKLDNGMKTCLREVNTIINDVCEHQDFVKYDLEIVGMWGKPSIYGSTFYVNPDTVFGEANYINLYNLVSLFMYKKNNKKGGN